VVIIVMGVSGSGKTVVGETLAWRLNWMFEDADNWHPASNIEKMHSGAPLTDEDREPWLRALNGAVRNWIADKRDVLLTCSALREWYGTRFAKAFPTGNPFASYTLRGPMRRSSED